MPDAFLIQCFWTYPDPALTVPPGQPLSFQVVIPPPLPVTFPITGSVVNWTLTDVTDSSNPKPLVQGEDYQVLVGDLHSAVLSLVFAPISSDPPRKVSVVPEVTLFYCDATGSVIKRVKSDSSYPQFNPQTYMLASLTADQQSRVIDTLKNSLRLTPQKTIIEPGDVALLKILPRATPSVPQVVTSILDEAPSVEIRGAVPLKSLVEAIVGPMTGALGSVAPGSKTSLEEVGHEVRRLLGESISIPIALDVLGKRVTKTLLPIGEPELPVFTSTPAETNSLEGLVPVGKWQSPFRIEKVCWKVVPTEHPNADLSPGVNFLKSYLLKPKIVPLSVGFDASPSTVAIRAKLYVDLPANVFSTPQSFCLDVPLQLLPLPLPRIAAIFKHAFNDPESLNHGDQESYVAVDAETAPFISSLDDCLRLVARLTTVLNNIVAVANVLGPDWIDLLDVATVLSVLSDQLGRTHPRYAYLVPVWRLGGETTWEKHDVVTAVISVGAPSHTHFELWGEHPSRHLVFKGSSIIPNLNGAFSEIDQIPVGSAVAHPDTYNYAEELETIRFVTEEEHARV
jgi:hypothetical protein